MRGVELPPLLPLLEDVDGPTGVLYLKERSRVILEELGTTTHAKFDRTNLSRLRQPVCDLS